MEYEVRFIKADQDKIRKGQTMVNPNSRPLNNNFDVGSVSRPIPCPYVMGSE